MRYVLSLLSFLIFATIFTAASEQKRVAVSANPPNYVVGSSKKCNSL